MYVSAGKLLIPPRAAGVVTRAAFEVLRPHQWLKNVLVFLPLLAAHRLADIDLLGRAIVTFIAFNLAASSVYVTNDIHDARADAEHPHKRGRPIPSGRLPVAVAWALVPLL